MAIDECVYNVTYADFDGQVNKRHALGTIEDYVISAVELRRFPKPKCLWL